ncbi:MAG: type I-U CRISPR-associated protein Csx17 [Cyanobacteria bacterium P01_F01_bin.150]
MTDELYLGGCTPEPLACYLKALGVLRLVVEQKLDANAKGSWQGNYFYLHTTCSADTLTRFFLHDYQPTPLINPWNGSTGFYPKDKAQKKLLESFCNAKAERFGVYGKTINKAKEQVHKLELTKQPSGEEKRRLLARLRNTLPDEAIKWLDTCALITSDPADQGGMSFPPLMGTGGNDGNFEFGRSFMQQLQQVIDLETGDPTELSERFLDAALFNKVVPDLKFFGKIGQFSPLAAGGANASPGYDAASRVNPWDFILMLEGTLLFIAGATRRYEQSGSGDFSYPFMVRPSNVGYGSAADGDSARAEIWVPLWQSPTRLAELQTLFREGRAKVGKRTARDGVDFARAISSFGVRRGVSQFIRYGFQERNGLSYFSIPLGRFSPHVNPQANRLAEIDGWLLSLDRNAQKDTAPASLKRSHRQLQTAIIRLAQQQNGHGHERQRKERMLDILIALGQIEASLDLSFRSKNEDEKFPRPVPQLSAYWVDACDDDSVEFRLACALAGQNLRERLVWVRPSGGRFSQWLNNDDGKTVWKHGALDKNLISLLKRQQIEALQQEKRGDKDASQKNKSNETNHSKQQKNLPKHRLPVASLDDVVCWIDGRVDDRRIEAIARGLSLVNLRSYRPGAKSPASKPSLAVPAAYSLVKLVHYRHLTQERLGKAVQSIFVKTKVSLPEAPLPITSKLLAKLATEQLEKATEIASRRLYASGYAPAIRMGLWEPGVGKAFLTGNRSRRIAAALAFPLSEWDMARLLKHVCKLKAQAESDTDSSEQVDINENP